MSQPLGFRNNNPFNIKINDNNNWNAKVKSTHDIFEQFDEMENGVRAGYILLNNYRKKYGLNTIASIIDRFAPDFENPTNKYAAFVANKLGITIDTLLTDDLVFDMGREIVRFENGQYLPDHVLLGGYNRAGI